VRTRFPLSARMPATLLGFDIGGTKSAVVLGRTAGDALDIVARTAFPTETARGPAHTLGRLEAAARTLLRTHDLAPSDVAALGVSCGGPLDSRRGVVLGPPNLPGWDDVPVTAHFEAALGFPAYLQNDANAGAVAEWRWGAGQGARSLVFLTFGTGMGAGLILDGRLYAGRHDLAGEVGHVRLADDGPVGHGKAGAFEGFCSGGGLARLAAARVRAAWARGEAVPLCPDEAALQTLDARRLARAARAGDPLALAVFETSGQALGRGLAMLMDVLAPDLIVIGSERRRCRDLLEAPALAVVAAEALPGAQCPVVPAALGETIGDYAALAVAHYGVGAGPL
jgi:glucokinase